MRTLSRLTHVHVMEPAVANLFPCVVRFVGIPKLPWLLFQYEEQEYIPGKAIEGFHVAVVTLRATNFSIISWKHNLDLSPVFRRECSSVQALNTQFVAALATAEVRFL